MHHSPMDDDVGITALPAGAGCFLFEIYFTEYILHTYTTSTYTHTKMILNFYYYKLYISDPCCESGSDI